MQRRIFWSIFLTALGAVLIVGLFTARASYKIVDARTSEELRAEAQSAAALQRLPNAEEYLNLLPDSRRITLISAEGRVLYDNHAQSGAMENHRARPEVQEALRSGRGESYRYSDTLTEKRITAPSAWTTGVFCASPSPAARSPDWRAASCSR